MNNRSSKRLFIIISVALLAIAAMVASYFVFYKNRSTDTRDKANTGDTTTITFGSSEQVISSGSAFVVKLYINNGTDNSGAALNADKKVTGAIIPLLYPKEVLEVDTAATEGSQSSDCNVLNTMLGVFDEPANGKLSLSKTTLNTNENTYPTGRFCFGSVTFRAKTGISNVDDYIDFDDANTDFEVIGRSGSSSITYSNTTSGRVRVYTTSATIPPTPTVTTNPTSGVTPTVGTPTQATTTPAPITTIPAAPTPTMTPTSSITMTTTPTSTNGPTSTVTPTNSFFTNTPTISGTTYFYTPTTNPKGSNTLPNTSGEKFTAVLILAGFSLVSLSIFLSRKRFK